MPTLQTVMDDAARALKGKRVWFMHRDRIITGVFGEFNSFLKTIALEGSSGTMSSPMSSHIEWFESRQELISHLEKNAEDLTPNMESEKEP